MDALKFESQPLSLAEESYLTGTMTSEGLKIAERIIRGRMAEGMARIGIGIVELESGAEGMREVIDGHVEDATKYRHFLEVVDELKSKNKPSFRKTTNI